MTYLLDTHIWVWALLEPRRLSARVRKALTSARGDLWLSPISVWEVLILEEKGRLRLEPDAQSWTDEALQRLPMREAPLTIEIARESRRLRWDRTDPADRFLLATARVLDLTLVTADRHLIEAKLAPVLANR